ncbi:uncharacterized protein LOC126878735 [Diabrotica virgifera virgifera]|uniref:Uncharacterized protein LOC114331243 n=1 Tax=Diabrotica virgifera virgifera TaxID=50390 RepID=A0A6P7FUX1_DIAVI|nr:uncharacterized protein LOC126878735 [Diabrotica virgifera virgifera]
MGVFCRECNKEFQTQSSLNPHSRNVHKKYENYIEYETPKRYCCKECNLFFNYNKDLRAHLLEKHDHITELVNLQFKDLSEFTAWIVSEQEQLGLKYSKTSGLMRSGQLEQHYYECLSFSITDLPSTSQYNELRKTHNSCTSQIKMVRNIETSNCTVSYFKTHYGHDEKSVQLQSFEKQEKKYICLQCKLTFNGNRDLRFHLHEEHGQPTELVKLEFENFLDFTVWMAQEEKNNYIQYCKNTGVKRHKEHETSYYECIRSSKNYPTKQNRERSLKSLGSCKMLNSCTSQIIVSKNIQTDCCTVTYFKTHYGHDNDIEHLHVPKSDKENIASKLILGVSSKIALKTVRDSIGGELKRADLITRKDITNIKHSYGIDLKDECRHKDDATSVHLWVTECLQTKPSPVLFYKQQGIIMDNNPEFKSNDFCLIFMNAVQKKMLVKFGKSVIAIDGTHGLNSYDFELTTILVRDEFENGFPTAFLFSNRKDTYIYQLFFETIRERVGIIQSNVFMSDITNTYYNAWSNVMGSVPNRLLCAWHIDRAWQVNVNKISDSEKKSYVYKMLKELQFELDSDKFFESLNNFLGKILNDADTSNFGRYFQQNYCDNIEQWANVYRKGCGINTNMAIENFHKVLKYFYLDKKKMKRLDKSIHQLILFLRDKTVERIIKLKKGKPDESSITSRHRTALACSFTMVQDNNVYILNEEKNEYLVERQKTVSCCYITCSLCNIYRVVHLIRLGLCTENHLIF